MSGELFLPETACFQKACKHIKRFGDTRIYNDIVFLKSARNCCRTVGFMCLLIEVAKKSSILKIMALQTLPSSG